MNKKILIKKFFTAPFLFSLLLLSSCCIFKTDNPELRITSQSFPGSANANSTFTVSFTVANISSGECDAATSNTSSVNLKMVNRATGYLQVNNNTTLNQLSNEQFQTINNTVNIGTPGTYDLTFTVDPNNTSGETNRNNNVFTGVIIIN